GGAAGRRPGLWREPTLDARWRGASGAVVGRADRDRRQHDPAARGRRVPRRLGLAGLSRDGGDAAGEGRGAEPLAGGQAAGGGRGHVLIAVSLALAAAGLWPSGVRAVGLGDGRGCGAVLRHGLAVAPL